MAFLPAVAGVDRDDVGGEIERAGAFEERAADRVGVGGDLLPLEPADAVGVDDRSLTKIRGKRGLDEGQSVKAEELVADVTADDFDALLVPGGQSPDHIRTNKDVQRFVKEFDQAKKPMFVICHGPQVLISAQLVRGRTLTGYASIADDIRNAGGLYRDQPVVQDGNWVTSRNPGDLILFNRAIIEKLAAQNAPV